MEKTMNFFFALALMAVAMVFASCSKDNDANSAEGNKEYAFMASYELQDPKSESAESQSEVLDKALLAAGFSSEGSIVYLTGKDSAEVASLLKNKIDLMKRAVEQSPLEIQATLEIRGAERKYFEAENDKEHPIYLWYKKSFSTPENDEDPKVNGVYALYHAFRWVESIWTDSKYSNDVYNVGFGASMNYGVKGRIIHLQLNHSGGRGDEKNDDKRYFEWKDSYANKYITDVIATYGGGESDEMVIEGRTYHKCSMDLNKGGGKEYIYLYTTSDPYPGYYGYYLNTGDSDSKKKHQCRTLCSLSSISAQNYCETFVAHGHKFVERPVKAYWVSNKKCEGELDANKGQGGHYVRIVLTYATKNAGY